jgi:monoamine oxidase
MNRRHFIKNTAFAAAATQFPFAFWEARNADVIILGAGISGLYAAHLLEKRGVKVLILEGSDRVGGRMMTTPDGVNLGGVEIGDGYKRIVGLAKEMNVDLEPPHAGSRDMLIHVKGQNITAKDWAKSEHNPLAEAEKTLIPPLVESNFLKNNPLKKLDDWCNPEFSAFDTPLSNFLKKQGASEAALQMANVAANYNDINSVSALHVLRSNLYRVAGGSNKTLRIKGGSQALPEAVAAHLKGKILRGQNVVAIDNSGRKKVTIHCENGAKYTASQVICTIPTPALQSVKIEKLTADHQKFISETQYTQILQVIFKPKTEFWKADGLPLSMWTDTSIERYLSEGSRHLVWINGIGTQPFLTMTDSEISQHVLNKLAEIRPSTKDNLEVICVNFWKKGRPFSGGAYYETQAGQASFFQNAIKPINNLHFAGEHTAVFARGMEGAVESAERAVTALRMS